LIERVLHTSRRPTPVSPPEVYRAPYPLRLFSEAMYPSAEEVDSAWLQRIELRSLSDVAHYLARNGFCDFPGMLTALFVDTRCGLIRSKVVSSARPARPDETVRKILRLASDCQASGIILATHDVGGRTARDRSCRELTKSLYQKGEAIEIFLLNHFVLTAYGWKRMMPTGKEGRS
jgi:DNA repair protein RadC